VSNSARVSAVEVSQSVTTPHNNYSFISIILTGSAAANAFLLGNTWTLARLQADDEVSLFEHKKYLCSNTGNSQLTSCVPSIPWLCQFAVDF
jgi:hypothetical protein